jgi:uncharacterized protein with PIN domain
MVIDTSAIPQDEPEWRAFSEAIEAASERRLSTATFAELSIIVEARLGPEGIRDLDLFPATAEIELAPLDTDQARLTRSAISAPWQPSSGGAKKD